MSFNVYLFYYIVRECQNFRELTKELIDLSQEDFLKKINVRVGSSCAR